MPLMLDSRESGTTRLSRLLQGVVLADHSRPAQYTVVAEHIPRILLLLLLLFLLPPTSLDPGLSLERPVTTSPVALRSSITRSTTISVRHHEHCTSPHAKQVPAVSVKLALMHSVLGEIILVSNTNVTIPTSSSKLEHYDAPSRQHPLITTIGLLVTGWAGAPSV